MYMSRLWLVIIIIIILAGGIFLIKNRGKIKALNTGLSQYTQKQFVSQFTSRPSNGSAPVRGEDTFLNLVTKDDPSLGNPLASLQIVEFIDFQCPFCRQSFPIMRRFMARHTSDVFYQVRDFPIQDLHPYAIQMAEAGGCANMQGKFWQLHDRMFQEVEKASSEQIFVWARQAGMDMDKFTACMQTGAAKDEVLEDLNVAISAELRGTPTFFINGYRFEGVIPEETLEEIWKNLKK